MNGISENPSNRTNGSSTEDFPQGPAEGLAGALAGERRGSGVEGAEIEGVARASEGGDGKAKAGRPSDTESGVLRKDGGGAEGRIHTKAEETGRPTGILTRAAVAGQRKAWSRRAASWDHGALPGLKDVVDRVIELAAPSAHDVVVDLGCGTGALALPIAEKAAKVVAVDLSDEMLAELARKAKSAKLDNIIVRAGAIENFQADPASVDIVVTNYALHHLRDPDKVLAVKRAYGWIKPGGRIVIGDMMFGRGSTQRDRRIISSKVLAFAKKGPAGWWRIAKNVVKFLLRVQERPAPMQHWVKWLEDAGFTGVTGVAVHSEAAIVYGIKPPL
ncbi:MAG: class I SAM-dependent methyltransferase [Acidimicrobiales bacterium]